MSYHTFKRTVLKAAGWQCENPNCDAAADTVHHFLKQSVWPQYREDPDNGMAACGRCHAEIERRLREGEDVSPIYPKYRFKGMCEKAGIAPEKVCINWEE